MSFIEVVGLRLGLVAFVVWSAAGCGSGGGNETGADGATATGGAAGTSSGGAPDRWIIDNIASIHGDAPMMVHGSPLVVSSPQGDALCFDANMS